MPNIRTISLSPGCRLISLYNLMDALHVASVEAIRDLCRLFGIPTIKTPRRVHINDKWVVVEEESVLAMSFELALFSCLMPGGYSVDLLAASDYDHDRETPPPSTEAVKKCNAAFKALPYFTLLRADPHAMQMTVALAAMLYGPYDKDAILHRLGLLGDLLVREARRHGACKRESSDPDTAVPVDCVPTYEADRFVTPFSPAPPSSAGAVPPRRPPPETSTKHRKRLKSRKDSLREDALRKMVREGKIKNPFKDRLPTDGRKSDVKTTAERERLDRQTFGLE